MFPFQFGLIRCRVRRGVRFSHTLAGKRGGFEGGVGHTVRRCRLGNMDRFRQADAGVANRPVLALLFQRYGEPCFFSVQRQLVSVDPAFFDERDIIKKHKRIDSMDKLEIPEIRKKIGLHDGYTHVSPQKNP